MRTWEISRAELIPEHLRHLPQWVCWRLENRGGKPTKPPVKVGGGYASSTDSSTWSTFDEVCDEYESDESLSGIGLMLAPSGIVAAVDLDHVLGEGGAVEPWAEQICETLHTYVEVSPSGTGLHLWCAARLPGPAVKTAGVELYDGTSGRYLTVTGRPWRPERYGLDLQSRQAELAAVYQQYAPHRDEGGAGGPGKGESWRSIRLSLDQHASPPFQKLELLREIDTRFDLTWRRKRPDLADQSASSYCLSLATHAAAVGWTPQEIADLLVAWRVKQGEGLKRADWYQRTIARALSGAPQAGQGAPLGPPTPRGAPPSPPPTVEAPGPAGEPEPPAPEDPEPEVPGAGGALLAAGAGPREEALRTVRSLLGLPLLRYYQIGHESAQYRVELSKTPGRGGGAGAGASSYVRRLGSAAGAIDQKVWRELTMEAVGRPFPMMRPGEWQRVLSLLAVLLEYEEVEDETSQQVALAQHLEESLARIHRDEESTKALEVGLPFAREGHVYLGLPWLLRSLKGRSAERWTRPDVINILKSLGWERSRVDLRPWGAKAGSNLRMWRRAE